MKLETTHQYVNEVARKQKSSEAREHAYRPLLENLLQLLLTDKYTVINDPARVGANAPDFLIKQGEVPSGYIEAKDVTVDLDDKAVQAQAERYLKAFDALILTNYIEFRFYHGAEEYDRITLNAETPDNDLQRFADVLTSFVQPTPRSIKSAKQLAEIMAHKSRIMRDVVIGLLKEQTETGDIQGQYQAFKQVLIRDLTIEQFADMYAQTLAYGLFVARYFDKSLKDFTRHEAQDLLPPANPLLRKFFGHIAGANFEPRLAWIIDDLIAAYSATDVHGIMHKEFERKEQDPVLHFYETYLKEYDPKLRKSRGVYYTPKPVVSFIVRSVDQILKKEFGLKDGLADTAKIPWEFKTQGTDKRYKDKTKKHTQDVHRVQILDPAAGTGTFLVEVIEQIRKRFANQEGQWPSYVKEHLLPRLHGFELMMASYTMAHLKLGITLGESGYKATDQRLGVYLTNSLEQGVTEVPNLFMSQWLTEESAAASRVKSELPIMVVIGNPPYDVSSSNKGEWIRNLIKVYKEGLGEKKINLDDDYIKFIRFAEGLIEKNGAGVVAMITNNSFVDGITHRQMRKHLLETFDDIYILDLHGSAKKQEKTSKGGTDENVFDIQQGVSIALCVKKDSERKGLGAARYAELRGTRELKFTKLNTSSSSTIPWKLLKPSEPYFFFVPKDLDSLVEYEKGLPIDKMFLVNNSGVKTDRDALFVDFDKKSLAQRMTLLFSGKYDAEFASEFRVSDSGSYKIIEKLRGKQFSEENLRLIQYRPFDYRWIYYDPELVSRPGQKAFKHLVDKDNIALLTCRQQSTFDFAHVFVTKELADICVVSLQTKETGYVLPLYLFADDGTKTSGLDRTMIERIESVVGRTTPEKVFDYVYAVLHTLSFRKKYKELLKIDFPRIPLPQAKKQFDQLVSYGKELRELHLMRSPKVSEFVTTYPEAGLNLVEKPTYKDGKVWINKEQYFGGVPQPAWEFYIGGYQPAQKWLKDRKGRELSSDDISHYQKIVKVLVETERVMGEIDKVWKP